MLQEMQRAALKLYDLAYRCACLLSPAIFALGEAQSCVSVWDAEFC
jgi:hypothetical protein